MALGTACSGHEHQAPPARVAAAPVTPPAPPPGDRARELVAAAQLEIQDLREIRGETTSPETRAAIDGQIAQIARWRDEVLADMGPRGGAGAPPEPARMQADASNLERAMRAGAATAPQAPLVPPIDRRGTAPGDYEPLPGR